MAALRAHQSGLQGVTAHYEQSLKLRIRQGQADETHRRLSEESHGQVAVIWWLLADCRRRELHG